MQSVNFTTENNIEKEFVSSLRKNVNQYFKTNNLSVKANTSMHIKTAVMISLYILPFIALMVFQMPMYIALIMVVIMGIGIAGVGMGVMHDACHGSYSKHQWVNDLLSGTLYLLGSNVLNWKIQHNVLHHTYTNVGGMDEDIEAKGPIRLSENSPLKKYHKYQFIYAFFFYGLMTTVVLIKDFPKLFYYNKQGLVKGQNKNLNFEFFKMVLRKFAYIVVVIGLPLLFTQFTLWQVLLGFFIMHWVASIILSFVFQMAHVVEGATQNKIEPVIQTDWAVHQLNTTSDFARHNKLLGWYIGGLNFQIEHHLFPYICHIHYPNIAPIVEKTAKEFGIKYNLKESFSSAFYSHIIRLKELGRFDKLTLET